MTDKHLESLQAEVDDHDVILRGDGNGRKGLAPRVDTLEAGRIEMRAAVAELKTEVTKVGRAVEALAQERRDDNARREGSKSTLNWIRWALGVIAILITLGGALGLTTLLDTLGTVSQQLNKIPSLPE